MMKKIWIEDIVEFDGKFYKIPKSKIGPKFTQKLDPKILLGRFSSKRFERIIKSADRYIEVLKIF